MAHPSWCIRLPLECRNVAPTALSAQSSVRATHAFGQQLWAIPHVLARQRLAFEACFRELRLESLPWIIMGRGRAQGSMEVLGNGVYSRTAEYQLYRYSTWQYRYSSI